MLKMFSNMVIFPLMVLERMLITCMQNYFAQLSCGIRKIKQH